MDESLLFNEDCMNLEDDENVMASHFHKRFLCKKQKLNNGQLIIAGEPVDFGEIAKTHDLATLSLTDKISNAKSTDLTEKLQGIVHIRNLISANIKIENDMNEIMSILIESLNVQNLQIQYEAAWALMNIVANKKSEEIQALFTPKVIIALIKLFDSTSDVNVANQVLLAIGNVIAENPGLCYQCICLGVIPSLVKQMMNFLANEEFIRTLSWVVANICHVKDQPTFRETGYDLLPILYQIVTKKDSETVVNSLWALTYLTDDGLEVLMNFEKSLIRDIVPHLTSSNIELKAASLHLLANIACGNDELTYSIIKYGTLEHLGKFLTGSNKEFKREAAWMLTNILAGTKKQIDAVFKAGLIQPLIELLKSDVEKIQEKAVWAITNIPLCGAKHHVFQLLDMDIIPPFCQCLNASRPYIIESTLEGIKMILEQSQERKEEVRQKLIECGAIEIIKRHEKEGNKRAQEHARKIISEYFTS